MAGDDSGRSSATPGSYGDGRRKKTRAVAAADIDDDELFELDIALLDGRGAGAHRGRNCSAAVDDAAAAAAGQHALLGNCLLPVRSVSSAVPVDATSSEFSSTTMYPYSGYHSSRRLVLFTGGVGRRFSFGRPAGHGNNSSRFRFSSRGFEAYFQRY